ncbi:MAG: hypothetical protein L3V56_10055 [Candidatus Magnetoovum sp. WYHC-5]|nr:hypothetical protein [Candidatus Magnetoovum sp. WYHC-5]
MQSNFMLKVEDAKLPDIQKALKSAGVKVKSIVEIYKEGDNKGVSEETPNT